MPPEPILYLTNAYVHFMLAEPPTSPNDSYNGWVSAAAIVPAAGDENTVVTLDGERHTRYGPTLYTADLTVQQDWATGGLSRFLWDNRGQMCYIGLAGDDSAASVTNPHLNALVTLMPGQMGGEAETWATAEVSLPVQGEPTLSETPVTAAMLDQIREIGRTLAAGQRIDRYREPLAEVFNPPAETEAAETEAA